MTLLDRYNTATARFEPPFAVVDLEAFEANARDLVRRARGKPIRVASKSVRCRTLLEQVLATEGFAGVMAFTLPEALWLAAEGLSDDILVAYPTVDRTALAELAARRTCRRRRHRDGRLRRAPRPDRERRRGAAGSGSASTSTPPGVPPAAVYGSARSAPPCVPPRRPPRWPGRSGAGPGFAARGADGVRVADRRSRRQPAGQAAVLPCGPLRSRPQSRVELARRRAAIVKAVRRVAAWSSSTAAAPAA